MKAPTRAIVLAAGHATRMRPLSFDTPKPLLPVWGRPAVARLLDMLARWGVREALINVHSGVQPIVDSLRRVRPASVRLSLSFEPQLMDTGGALARAAWFIGRDPFWLVNADIAADVSPSPLLSAFERARPLAALWVTDAAGPRTVESRAGRITTFRSSRPGSPGTWTFCGLHLADPRVLDAVPRDRPSSIIDAYDVLIARRHAVLAVPVAGSFWADLGNPEAYLDAHRVLLDRHRRRRPGAGLFDPGHSVQKRDRVRVTGFLAAGPSVRTAPGARFENTVALDGARFGPKTRARSAVVARDTTVDGPVSGIVMPAAAARDAHVELALRRLRWPADRTTAVFLDPRGSARRFIRVQCGSLRAVVVAYSDERAENLFYANHARFLAHLGIPVPCVRFHLPRSRIIVLDDLGDTHLLDAARASLGASTQGIYERVLAIAARLHREGAAALRRRPLPMCDPFAPSLYRWEHELFAGYFLRRRMRLAPRAVHRVLAELDAVSRVLDREPRVLIHRDLQSTNVMLRRREPFLIDFQGMRLGPASYDIASLLCDPYVSLPPAIQAALLARYAALAARPERETLATFWWAAIQRLTQAIGAFGRLASVPATARFAEHIMPGLRMLDRALAHVDNLAFFRHVVSACLNKEGHP